MKPALSWSPRTLRIFYGARPEGFGIAAVAPLFALPIKIQHMVMTVAKEFVKIGIAAATKGNAMPLRPASQEVQVATRKTSTPSSTTKSSRPRKTNGGKKRISLRKSRVICTSS